MKPALVSLFALSADASDDAAEEVLRDGLLAVQVPARRALAVPVFDGEVDDTLLPLARQLTFIGKAEETVHRIEAVLALLAVAVVPLEGDRAREAPHGALSIASFHRNPIPAPRAGFPRRLI